MRAIPWDQSLELGVAEMDGEHRELVWRMNLLIAEMSKGADEHRIVARTEDLALFTARHFAHEEASMRAHDYHGLNAHKTEHDHLLAQLDAVSDRLATDGMAAVDDALIEFLHQWVVHHVVTMDRAFAHFLQHDKAHSG